MGMKLPHVNTQVSLVTPFQDHGNTLTLMDTKMYPGHKTLNVLNVGFSSLNHGITCYTCRFENRTGLAIPGHVLLSFSL